MFINISNFVFNPCKKFQQVLILKIFDVATLVFYAFKQIMCIFHIFERVLFMSIIL
jgi:hypothetical protein